MLCPLPLIPAVVCPHLLTMMGADRSHLLGNWDCRLNHVWREGGFNGKSFGMNGDGSSEGQEWEVGPVPSLDWYESLRNRG